MGLLRHASQLGLAKPSPPLPTPSGGSACADVCSPGPQAADPCLENQGRALYLLHTRGPFCCPGLGTPASLGHWGDILPSGSGCCPGRLPAWTQWLGWWVLWVPCWPGHFEPLGRSSQSSTITPRDHKPCPDFGVGCRWGARRCGGSVAQGLWPDPTEAHTPAPPGSRLQLDLHFSAAPCSCPCPLLAPTSPPQPSAQPSLSPAAHSLPLIYFFPGTSLQRAERCICNSLPDSPFLRGPLQGPWSLWRESKQGGQQLCSALPYLGGIHGLPSPQLCCLTWGPMTTGGCLHSM